MDLRMPQMDGVSATGRLEAAHPGVSVVVLTTYETDGDILCAVEAGTTVTTHLLSGPGAR